MFFFISFGTIDILCQGQPAETVIPIDNNRKFVVCIDTGKGTVQECPKGLWWHPVSRRCERSTLFVKFSFRK